MQISQCGFTRLGGQSTDAGWQSFPLDDAISQKAVERYALYQNQNIITDSQRFESGDVHIREIVCDSDFLYCSRVQYGLSDELGRQNNIFSHAIVFPMESSVYTDPNLFLTISDSNYISSYDERGLVKTNLEKTSSFSIQQALQEVGINEEMYVKLVFSYYAAIEQKKHLFIRNCSSEKMMQQIIFLVFSALPYSHRRQFSCTEKIANSGNTRQVVFAEPSSPGNLYFDISNGDNNILTPRLEKKYERYGFAGYFAINHFNINSNDYFSNLENTTVQIGDKSASNPSAMKMAHQMIMGGDPTAQSLEDCKVLIHEALLANYPGEFMDDYLASILRRLNKDTEILPDDAESLLLKRMSAGGSRAFHGESLEYITNSLTRKDINAAISCLDDLDGELFTDIARMLGALPEGKKTLSAYFNQKLASITNFAELTSLYEKFKSVAGDSVVADEFDCRAHDIYLSKMAVSDKRVAFDEYISFMHNITSDLDGCKISAKEDFWEQERISTFDLEKIEEYKYFYDHNIEKAKDYALLIDLFNYLQLGDYKSFLQYAQTFARNNSSQISAIDRYELWSKLLNGCEKQGAGISSPEKEYCSLLFITGLAKLDDLLFKLMDLANRGDLERFTRVYRENLDVIEHNACDQFDSSLVFAKCFLAYVLQNAKGKELSLDSLLCVGETVYKNPFSILDGEIILPDYVLDLPPEVVLEESSLLRDPQYINQAEEYVADRNAEAATVKKWINLSYKLNAKLEREQAKQQKRLKSQNSKSKGFHPFGLGSDKDDDFEKIFDEPKQVNSRREISPKTEQSNLEDDPFLKDLFSEKNDESTVTPSRSHEKKRKDFGFFNKNKK